MMKNEAYFDEATAGLRADQHLPERVLVLSDDDIVATTQSVCNRAADIARATKVDMELDLPHYELHAMMLAAHRLDITLNQYVERAVSAAIGEEKAKRLYAEENPEGDWNTLSYDEQTGWYR
jgi:hypothetical protein